MLSGRLQLGIIPTLAPYVLPRVLPRLQRRYPQLRLELRETQTKQLLEELERGDLDVVAAGVAGGWAPTSRRCALFDDPFLLAVPAADALAGATAASRRRTSTKAGLFCSRKATACATRRWPSARRRARRSRRAGLGATSLATVMQMVANGYGVTLLPEVAAEAEGRDARVKLLRFSAQEPMRSVGLAFRRTSPRRKDFAALGKVIVEALAVSKTRPPK